MLLHVAGSYRRRGQWVENTAAAGHTQAVAAVDAVFAREPAPSTDSLLHALTDLGIPSGIALTYLESQVALRRFGTVSEICPADIDPTFASQEFGALTAGIVSQNGIPILRVLAGQLKSGSGDAFVHKYLGDLADKTRDGVGVPSYTEQVGAQVVTHFNVPLTAEGYAYADGPTVEDGLTHILDNLH